MNSSACPLAQVRAAHCRVDLLKPYQAALVLGTCTVHSIRACFAVTSRTTSPSWLKPWMRKRCTCFFTRCGPSLYRPSVSGKNTALRALKTIVTVADARNANRRVDRQTGHGHVCRFAAMTALGEGSAGDPGCCGWQQAKGSQKVAACYPPTFDVKSVNNPQGDEVVGQE